MRLPLKTKENTQMPKQSHVNGQSEIIRLNLFFRHLKVKQRKNIYGGELATPPDDIYSAHVIPTQIKEIIKPK